MQTKTYDAMRLISLAQTHSNAVWAESVLSSTCGKHMGTVRIVLNVL